MLRMPFRNLRLLLISLIPFSRKKTKNIKETKNPDNLTQNKAHIFITLTPQ